MRRRPETKTQAEQRMRVTLPIRTVNALNSREHWGKRARRAAQERMLARIATPKNISCRCAVTLTRIGPRRMDSDGLAASLKHVRDGVADGLGAKNDSDETIEWRYAQEIGKDYAVRIEITDCR